MAMFKITQNINSAAQLFFVVVFTCLFVLPMVKVNASDQAFLKAGVDAISSKQFDKAINHLSKALDTGTLSPEDTAKAYYYRGLAYNGKSEPARSIADLSNALFFKKNPPSLKSKILVARARAYRAVGLVSRADNDMRASGSAATTIASVASVKRSAYNQPQAQRETNTRSSSGGFFQQRRQQQPQKKPAVTQGWGASVSSNPVRQQPTRIARVERQEPARTSSNSANSRSGNSGSNQNYRSLFEAKARKVEERPVRQARIQRQELPARKQYTSPVARQSSGGRYRLQLAAVSSENDAKAAWSRLVSQHASLLSSQNPDFQTVNLGGSRSVVRIQIGPFSDKLSTLQLCNTFKQQGLDCFLVVR